MNKSLRTATLLTCIGSDALHVYEGLEFANEDDKKGIDVVLQLSYSVISLERQTKEISI